ncbi:excinuclease ABC subunit UvrA [Psychroflexus sp. YR1-1]|uniref:UvrABC system protein A n=1 Tax=Psychroflexus aurantiacus TaxID=2709310 RepID=A0A6B3R0K1_9FLAO|nr:excinuclease ABC subunit UvrA [Psychroflexus aurantiacus]NEV94059.1 excinuclease ABC subunit UvrA [Psychroflexus aurantiacus]
MKHTDLDKIDPKDFIIIKGAKLHNLKNINVVIPRNKLVVITGLSGSGKSSLAFDTLYAEGQRRYVESLSAYARQFLGRLDKPKVDYIKGIAPAIAIEQKVNSTNPRSTVGTSTEIYDYLKLLYARIGKTISPVSGRQVKKHTVTDVVDFIKSQDENKKLLLLAPITLENKRTVEEKLNILQQQGFSRIKVDDQVLKITEAQNQKISGKSELSLVVDRIVVKDDEDFYNRLADSIQNAFFEGKGELHIEDPSTHDITNFNNKFELDGMLFTEPNVHLFSFNNPIGACPKCEGYGDIVDIDEALVIPNTGLSVYEGAVAPWSGDTLGWYKKEFIKHAHKFNFPVHTSYFELTEDQKNTIWEGNQYVTGVNAFFEAVKSKAYKIQNRVLLSRYRGRTRCPECKGRRLKKEATFVKINDVDITQLVDLPIDKVSVFFKKLKLNKHDEAIGKRLLKEVNNRLKFLMDVGLTYLTLNRKSNSLSGGESQRINLATSLGSSLVGSMYILDEPSIGLHSKDNERLIEVLKDLRDLGNTVIVVEHDEDIMKAADYIIDIGPEAGTHGGDLVAEGTYKQLLKANSLTSQYLNGKMEIEVPKERRTSASYVEIKGAREHNLNNISVKVPLDCFVAITGVSGSGKSTLVKKILYPAMIKQNGGYGTKAGQFDGIDGNFKHIKLIEYVDQNPIGRSSRSNPVTYIKAYDDIRNLYAKQKLSKIRNFKPKHFSFNVEGGRCEVCEGEGEVTIEMQFMADVHLECEACQGKRFKQQVLDVEFEGKNIDDILTMTIDDAMEFFSAHNETKISNKLMALQSVGLGYVTLGQSSSTLSGGEAQRIKLASFLTKGKNADKTLFIFDEPTTGLHFHDISKLLKSFEALIENGHSVIVIEHNIDLIKCADHIIDLGPGGGINGGQLVAEGTPEEVSKVETSFTGQFLKSKI